MSSLLLDDVFREIEVLEKSGVAVLPRLGIDLVGLVKVIVKSRGELPAALIAQAICRRAVVLELIKEGKARGHKDFAKITLAYAEKRALQLPVNGCMPELVYHGDSDGGLSKILNQKVATPQKIEQEAKHAFTDYRPNIISLQRSTYQEHDDSIVKANAWDALAQRLKGVPDITISPAADMLDSFAGDFLSRAFPFVYKSQLAQPDGPRVDSLRKQNNGPQSLYQHTRSVRIGECSINSKGTGLTITRSGSFASESSLTTAECYMLCGRVLKMERRRSRVDL